MKKKDPVHVAEKKKQAAVVRRVVKDVQDGRTWKPPKPQPKPAA